MFAFNGEVKSGNKSIDNSSKTTSTTFALLLLIVFSGMKGIEANCV
jgi:hypothetical protein